jgi:hypothetical protein
MRLGLKQVEIQRPNKLIVYSVKTGDKPMSDNARFVGIGERGRKKADRKNEET